MKQNGPHLLRAARHGDGAAPVAIDTSFLGPACGLLRAALRSDAQLH
ncbi:hypothetical protein ACWDUX_15675 [Streptomyces sp. NPDC003444]